MRKASHDRATESQQQMSSPISQPTALTIAGSDSGGGAGIQADLKTFAAHDIYGVSAITAITAQNTLGATAIAPVACPVVQAQITTVLADFDVKTIKTGMLVNAEIVDAVCGSLEAYPAPPLVIDPVMIATSGDRLLDKDAVTLGNAIFDGGDDMYDIGNLLVTSLMGDCSNDPHDCALGSLSYRSDFAPVPTNCFGPGGQYQMQQLEQQKKSQKSC